MVRNVQRLLLGPARMVVGAAAEVLSRLEGALTRLADETPQAEPGDVDEKVRAVRAARQAALARRDAGLAGRLAVVEEHLIDGGARSRSDVLLPGRGAGSAGLEDIRRQLLANTPRPDDTADDE